MPTFTELYGILGIRYNLLKWGIYGKRTEELKLDEQATLIRPVERILKLSGCELCTDRKKLKIRCKSKEKELVIYPAMWKKTSLSQVNFFCKQIICVIMKIYRKIWCF